MTSEKSRVDDDILLEKQTVKMSSPPALVIVVLLIVAAGLAAIMYLVKQNKSGGPSPPSSFPTPPTPPTPPPPPLIDAAQLQAMWNGKGLIHSSMGIDQVCPQFKGGNKPCIVVSQCKIPDISDYAVLNQILAEPGTGVSCFALATTLQRKGLAQITYGPYPGNGQTDSGDVTVGVFLDLSVLGPYIACMSSLDSGSVGRYGASAQQALLQTNPRAKDRIRMVKANVGNPDTRIAQAMQITPHDMKNRYTELLDNCKKNDNCGLYLAGCAGSGGNPANNGYYFATQPYDAPTYTPPNGPPELAKGWVYSVQNGIQLFGRDNLEEFVKTTAGIQKIVGAQNDESARVRGGTCEQSTLFDGTIPVSAQQSCPDYWSYQYLATDGDAYRENELDVFVPQDIAADPSINKCIPAEEFVRDFRKAVIGVYATPYCGNAVYYVKDYASPCCTPDFSKRLAKAMADKYNSTPGVPHRIQAYYWKTDPPDGKWQPDDHDRLQIELIP